MEQKENIIIKGPQSEKKKSFSILKALFVVLSVKLKFMTNVEGVKLKLLGNKNGGHIQNGTDQ